MANIQPEIEEKNEELIIKLAQPKANLFVLTILFLLAFVSIGMCLGFIKNTSFGVDVILGLLAFVFVSIYLTRLLLWNAFGNEWIILKRDSVTQIFDYKLFKSKGGYSFDQISVDFEMDGKMKEEEITDEAVLDSVKKVHHGDGHLILVVSENDFIRSSSKLAYQDLLKIEKAIDIFFK